MGSLVLFLASWYSLRLRFGVRPSTMKEVAGRKGFVPSKTSSLSRQGWFRPRPDFDGSTKGMRSHGPRGAASHAESSQARLACAPLAPLSNSGYHLICLIPSSDASPDSFIQNGSIGFRHDNLGCLCSGEDTILPSSVRRRAYRSGVPSAEVHILDGGHFVMGTKLAEAMALVRAFMIQLPINPRSTGPKQ
jgi:hypothetical protein